MSGGSMNHLYILVRDAEFHTHSPERKAFREHLMLVANALRAIEWNDSGDGDDQEVHNIMACISLSASENEMLRAEVERLHQAHQAACEGGGLLREEIERLTRERNEARAEVERLTEWQSINHSEQHKLGWSMTEFCEGKRDHLHEMWERPPSLDYGIAHIEAEIKRLRADNARLRADVPVYSSEIERLREEMPVAESLRVDAKCAEIERDEARAAVWKQAKEIADLRAEVEDLRDKTERLQSNNDNLTLERDETRAEVERLREENERLYNEDTKTRHALKGWVFVCPDGGADPTHERVAAVVAEVERLRAEIPVAASLKIKAECAEIERDEARAAVWKQAKEIADLRADVERLRGDAKAIAAIAHTGGTHGLSEHEALVEIRRRTLKAWDGGTSREALEAKS